MDKTCFKCGERQPITEFYRHKQMADGHLNKCKGCTKQDVKENRSTKIEYYTKYDRKRAMLPHRVDMRAQYQQTEAGKAAIARSHQTSNARYPEKRAARIALCNAVRDGKILRPDRCSRCKTECIPHGHHHDYSKPLDVEWLCAGCHKEEHQNENHAR